MKKYKRVIYFIILLLALWSCEKTYRRIGMPYPTVGIWKLEATEKELIEIGREINKEHQSMNHPLLDVYIKSKRPEHLGFHFYYPDTKEIVSLCITPTNNSSIKSLEFISLTDSNDKLIPIRLDGDLNFLEIYLHINKFENRVIDVIEQKLEIKRKAAQDTR